MIVRVPAVLVKDVFNHLPTNVLGCQCEKDFVWSFSIFLIFATVFQEYVRQKPSKDIAEARKVLICHLFCQDLQLSNLLCRYFCVFHSARSYDVAQTVYCHREERSLSNLSITMAFCSSDSIRWMGLDVLR